MAARLVKCYGYCGNKYPKDRMIKFQNANHCPECYERKVKEVKDREALYNLLKQVFSINFPTGLMLRQIKQYKEERSYSYKNIAFTVDYIVNVKKQKLQLQYGIALVPHYYDEMIEYYKRLQEKRSKTTVKAQEFKTIKLKPFKHPKNYYEKISIDMKKMMDEIKEEIYE